MKKILFVILVIFLSGCTTGPTLYPCATSLIMAQISI
jgi:hypothetical protein